MAPEETAHYFTAEAVLAILAVAPTKFVWLLRTYKAELAPRWCRMPGHDAKGVFHPRLVQRVFTQADLEVLLRYVDAQKSSKQAKKRREWCARAVRRWRERRRDLPARVVAAWRARTLDLPLVKTPREQARLERYDWVPS